MKTKLHFAIEADHSSKWVALVLSACKVSTVVTTGVYLNDLRGIWGSLTNQAPRINTDI